MAKIVYGLAELIPEAPTAITIGAFDGVHLGHQALIRALCAEAQALGYEPWVLTFDPLPRQVFERGVHDAISSLDQRLARLSQLDIAGVVVLPFNSTFINMPAVDFVDRVVASLQVKGFWIGADFRFGQGQKGDVALLQRMAQERGYQVRVFSQTVCWQGSPVRSSRIRAALKSGELVEANGCLGYPYELEGIVVHGDQRGKLLGFPTANLNICQEILLPANGVYICYAYLMGKRYEAITNVGIRPTFNHALPTVEVHLLDFTGDIYGQAMRLAFLQRLRPERRFASAAELINQIRADKAEARAWFEAAAPAKSHD